MEDGRGAVVAFSDIEDRLRADEDIRRRDALLAAQQESLRRVATVVAGGAASADVFAAVAREVASVLELPLLVMSRFDSDESATVIGAWADRPTRFRLARFADGSAGRRPEWVAGRPHRETRSGACSRLGSRPSARSAVADVRGQRRMQHLDGLQPVRCDAVEDPLAGPEQDWGVSSVSSSTTPATSACRTVEAPPAMSTRRLLDGDTRYVAARPVRLRLHPAWNTSHRMELRRRANARDDRDLTRRRGARLRARADHLTSPLSRCVVSAALREKRKRERVTRVAWLPTRASVDWHPPRTRHFGQTGDSKRPVSACGRPGARDHADLEHRREVVAGRPVLGEFAVCDSEPVALARRE
jgi:hypothetical protein